jgi:hypothetical protein
MGMIIGPPRNPQLPHLAHQPPSAELYQHHSPGPGDDIMSMFIGPPRQPQSPGANMDMNIQPPHPHQPQLPGATRI